jgi:hypothetical protein
VTIAERLQSSKDVVINAGKRKGFLLSPCGDSSAIKLQASLALF